MSGFFALSVNPETYEGNFSDDIFWETFYQQHLGQDYAGLVTYNAAREPRIKIRTHRGLFRPTFSEDMTDMEGTEGIGYCGDTREPILVDSKLGEFAACFTGNLINRDELVERFKTFGHNFTWGGVDIEVVLKLIAQGDGYVDGIKRMNSEVKGAYSCPILTSEGIYAVCDPSGRWPLVIGEKTGAKAITTDPCGFENWGFTYQRDLEPGEIVLIKNGCLTTKDRMLSDRIQICTFVWVYTNYPNAVFKGIPVSAVRERLGAILARRDIARGFIPDIVTPVPDSGRHCAIGYHNEFCRQRDAEKIKRTPLYNEVLIKYAYAGRSYGGKTQEKRNLEAHIKQLKSGESYVDKVVAVCDDSIRRGTQTERNLVPKLNALGIKEIHFRISNPDSISYCCWGKTVQKGELLASRISSIEKRIEFLGVKSLEHSTVEELAEAIGLPLETLCVDCDLPVTD